MADTTGSEDRETSLYLTQIRYLDEQLERCQLKCDELEKQNEDLTSQYSMLEEDKRSITEYLKHSLAAKEKKVDELTEQLESQQQAAEQDREALKLQYSQQMQELQEQVDELNSVNLMQAAKSEERKEQWMQLMQQLSDMEALQKQLVSQKKEQEADIHSLEAELERKKLTKEKTVEERVKMTPSNVLEEERAQRSEQLKNDLLLLSEKISQWNKKRFLQGGEDALCSEVDSLKKKFNKITQKIFTCKKEVEQLKKKCQKMEVELKDCSTIHEHMLSKEEDLRQNLASASEKCCQKTIETDQLGAKLQRESSRRRKLEGVMQEAVIMLRHILTDSENPSDTQWKMERLLDVLESTDLEGQDFTLNVSTVQKPQSSEPKRARAETLNLATDPLFLLARYRPGDLGLVPPPTWKHKPAVSTSTQLLLNRKLCTKKTSSSDPSAPAPQQTVSEAGTSTSADY